MKQLCLASGIKMNVSTGRTVVLHESSICVKVCSVGWIPTSHDIADAMAKSQAKAGQSEH